MFQEDDGEHKTRIIEFFNGFPNFYFMSKCVCSRICERVLELCRKIWKSGLLRKGKAGFDGAKIIDFLANLDSGQESGYIF